MENKLIYADRPMEKNDGIKRALTFIIVTFLFNHGDYPADAGYPLFS